MSTALPNGAFLTADLARKLELDQATVLGALSAYAQAGRAIYDLSKGVYRIRELSREPLPMDKLRFANEREEAATRFIAQKAVSISGRENKPENAREIKGAVKDKEKIYECSILIDSDERMKKAVCSCNFYLQNKLFKGPCEHILALRMQSNG
jgi:hypothetical protein